SDCYFAPTGDCVGSFVTALSNGNYVIGSPNWNVFRGAATWGNGTTGIRGTIDANNSFVGSNTFDQLAFGGVTALTSGNYVAGSPGWDSGRGAATWADGTIGITGTVEPNNSLVGSNTGDRVSYNGVTALGNGNYVVLSPYWNSTRGAVTWEDGTTG